MDIFILSYSIAFREIGKFMFVLNNAWLESGEAKRFAKLTRKDRDKLAVAMLRTNTALTA